MQIGLANIVLLTATAALAYPLTRKIGSRVFYLLSAVLAVSFTLYATLIPKVLQVEPAEVAHAAHTEMYDWLPSLDLNISFTIDALSLIMVLLVTGAGSLILFYCANYFQKKEPGIARFASVFTAFSAVMAGLVTADNIYLLFVFWEATSVFSFLLIGHATRSRTANSSALQAFIVTSLGGLAMLVGLVMLGALSGTASLAALTRETPGQSPQTICAIYLVAVGALSKSAIFPFHFWLPGAMTAPTPVSAYLHAAAMVKGGIYLLLRILPAYADTPGLTPLLLVLGAVTVLLGGFGALNQFDIKLILANSTVSQLGMLVLVVASGTEPALYAGIALTLAHALAKAPLFLTVGIVDHERGTRDLRFLHGVGRQFPGLAAAAALAAVSLAGLPPLFGFAAKEGALQALWDETGYASLSFVFLALASVFTFLYTGRFLWAVFLNKREYAGSNIFSRASSMPVRSGASVVDPVRATFAKPLNGVGCDTKAERRGRRVGMLLFPVAFFALLSVAAGFFAGPLSLALQNAVRAISSGSSREDSVVLHDLALWHGFTPALAVSVTVFALGLVLLLPLCKTRRVLPKIPEKYTAMHLYWQFTKGLDTLAVRLTALTQRGSLPFYLAIILTFSATSFFLLVPKSGLARLDAGTSVQLLVAVTVIPAALTVTFARTRFMAILLVGVTGFGMAALFALHGAPDLALTQTLVETVSLIAFVLVIRRLPPRIRHDARVLPKIVRILLAVAISLAVSLGALAALGARKDEPIWKAIPELAVSGGHGMNVVGVLLVDMRGWDTMGELSVIIAAATGVASLIFLSTRADVRPRLSRKQQRSYARAHLLRVQDPNDPASRVAWLLAGRRLDPENRSILLEVVVRVIFHALIVFSVYLLLTGHNNSGGGFAAGLVAGLALVARYLAGGRYELGVTVPVDAGKILAGGLALATFMAALPLFFGQAALSSFWVEPSLGPFGSLSVVSSTLFDAGIYLVVFGLVLDVLRSLGGQLDVHELEDEKAARDDLDAGARIGGGGS